MVGNAANTIMMHWCARTSSSNFSGYKIVNSSQLRHSSRLELLCTKAQSPICPCPILAQADKLGRLTFHQAAFLLYLRRTSYHSISGIMLPFVNKDAPQPAKTMYGVPTPVVCAYGAVAFIGYLVFHTVAERESTSVLTMSWPLHGATNNTPNRLSTISLKC